MVHTIPALIQSNIFPFMTPLGIPSALIIFERTFESIVIYHPGARPGRAAGGGGVGRPTSPRPDMGYPN